MTHERIRNFYEQFEATAIRFSSRVAIEVQRRDRVDSLTYGELRQRAESAAAWLASRGVAPGDRCVLLGDNHADWCAAYLGILRLGAVAVPFDTHYSPAQIATLLRDCEARLCFTTPHYLAAMEEANRVAGFAVETALLHGEVAGLASVAEPRGEAAAALAPCPATREDPAVVLYTSGTTSDPKGVVLTHGNLLAEAESVFQVVRITEQDAILGVLPLFHALAQMANLLLPFLVGARVVFLEELNSSELLRALRERNISAFACVPQFFYLIHQRILAQVATRGRLRQTAFRGLLAANGALRQTIGANLGGLFFHSVHDVFGPRMRVLVTGGARFDPSVARDFYRLGFNIQEAYGLTESSGAAVLTGPGEAGFGAVGRPLPGIEVKILPVVLGGEDGRRDGEIAIRGPIVMQGYFRRPDANAATLQDGWLLTGDLGFIDAQGRLTMTGRKKEVIILSSGKNIYPEEVEAHYAQSPYIKELCVLGLAEFGEPAAERLHAIIVPDLDVMRERKVLNMREVLRFEVENLSVHLPSHKRILGYEIWMEQLPRTTTNKLKRFEIERRAREGSTAGASTAAEPEPETEEDTVWAADPDVARALERVRVAARHKDAVRPGANLELDLGLDSIERVELLADLEQLYAARVPEEVTHRIYTVRELVDAARAAATGTGFAAPAAPTGDAWGKLLSDLPKKDSALSGLLEPHPVVALFVFAALKLWYLLARLLLRFRATGLENLPHEGGYLISPNHQSYLDAFLLCSALPFRTVRMLFFVGASEYFATPFRRRIARLLHIAPVDPDTNLVRAMQAGAFGLSHGKILILFPEGERSIDGEVKKFKKGAAILSLQLQVPAVPVALDGVFDVWPRNRPLRWSAFLPGSRARVQLRFGAPLPTPPPLSPGATKAQAEARYASAADDLRRIVVEMQAALRQEAAPRSPSR